MRITWMFSNKKKSVFKKLVALLVQNTLQRITNIKINKKYYIINQYRTTEFLDWSTYLLVFDSLIYIHNYLIRPAKLPKIIQLQFEQFACYTYSVSFSMFSLTTQIEIGENTTSVVWSKFLVTGGWGRYCYTEYIVFTQWKLKSTTFQKNV